MPLVKISLLNNWTEDRIKSLNDAIHTGLKNALNIEDWDYFHRVHKYCAAEFIFPDFKSQDFMIVELFIFPGRSDKQKEMIYQNICEKVAEIGVSAQDIFIHIIEQPDINWGIGGKPRKVKES